ncbi:MAG TPA: alpha/beta hydrolase [Polyangiaceae bacterium]|nr:alpha/beta hydrolase [Polyangiaceae bacterium]
MTFVLIPGAGGTAWYWHRVTPLLERAGHEAIAVDLPGDDPNAGLRSYADLVIEAIGERSDLVLVAQSMGAFTAALVCARVPIGRLVFVNAMIPVPDETAGDWWDNTGWLEARTAAAERRGYAVDFDLDTYFLHDVPRDIARSGAEHQREEAQIAFTEPVSFQTWPDVPIHVVVGKDDRFFPNDFQARLARERLGKEVDEVPGGHLVALSYPRELADRLLGYVEG